MCPTANQNLQIRPLNSACTSQDDEDGETPNVMAEPKKDAQKDADIVSLDQFANNLRALFGSRYLVVVTACGH
jgi:hypothetical protein